MTDKRSPLPSNEKSRRELTEADILAETYGYPYRPDSRQEEWTRVQNYAYRVAMRALEASAAHETSELPLSTVRNTIRCRDAYVSDEIVLVNIAETLGVTLPSRTPAYDPLDYAAWWESVNTPKASAFHCWGMPLTCDVVECRSRGVCLQGKSPTSGELKARTPQQCPICFDDARGCSHVPAAHA